MLYERLSQTKEKVGELDEIIEFIGAVIARLKDKKSIRLRRNDKLKIVLKYPNWE